MVVLWGRYERGISLYHMVQRDTGRDPGASRRKRRRSRRSRLSTADWHVATHIQGYLAGVHHSYSTEWVGSPLARKTSTPQL
jgi:hypothetical protein